MEIGRRTFLRRAGAAVAGLAALDAPGCSDDDGPPEGWVAAGPVAELTAGEYTERRVRMAPELDGGYLETVWLRLAAGGGKPRVVALSGLCTHLGCPVRYVVASRRFICPCHGGVFGFDGAKMTPIVPRALDRYPAKVHDDTVYLGPRIRSPGPPGPAGF